MRTLSLMEQGLRLSVDGELFVVEKGAEVLDRIRSREIGEILVFGSVELTSAAIAASLARGIDVVFLTARGRYRGRLLGHQSRNVALRLRQCAAVGEPELALNVARAIVAGKAANQRNLLLRAQREQRRDDLAKAIADQRRLFPSIETAPSLDSLRGLEGQCAALYFGALGKCIRNPMFAFTRRSRRPPRDPANAVLSFGYTMLGTLAESVLLRVGLDPMLGFLHAAEHGRPSLALDLIEEFRPLLVDSLMLRLVNRRELTAEDFEQVGEDEDSVWSEEPGREPADPEPHGVWMADTGRRVFFRAWGRRLRETVFYEPRGQTLELEAILRQQAFRLARVLQGQEDSYRAFVPR